MDGSTSGSALTVPMTVVNTGTVAISSLALKLYLVPDGLVTENFNASSTTTPAGCTVSPLSAGGGNGVSTPGTYTFVYVYSGGLAPGAAIAISPVVTLGNLPGSGTLTVSTTSDTKPSSGDVTKPFA